MPDSRSIPARSRVDAQGLSVFGQHPWRVRLRGPDGAVVGAGVLVDRWHVLTCAHVISAALGVAPSETPAGEVGIELPFAPATEATELALGPVLLRARIAAHGWAPPSPRGGGDLTLLRLEQPAPAEFAVARLARTTDNARSRVMVYGHPDGLDEGVWAHTSVSGVGGPGGEWLQLDADHFAGRSVTRGFSGAGVVDEGSGQVLGIVVAEDGEADTRVAWAIRTEVAVAYLPLLAALLQGGADSADTRGPGVEDSPKPSSRPVASGSMCRLSDAEWEHLLALLLAVPGMVEKQSRDLYLRLLERRFGIRLTLPRHSSDRLEIVEVMQALVDRPRSARCLVAVLESVHPQTRQVADLEEFVERTFPDVLLEHAERVRLERLLDGVAPVWVERQ